MSLDELAYVKHMLDEARYLTDAAANLERAAFLGDPTLQRAFVRSLEIIGEAAKHVSEPFRASHGSIPWRAMAGMRGGHAMLFDPGGTSAPGRYDASVLPCAVLKTSAPEMRSFRGSITRPARSLISASQRRLPDATQDSLAVGGQPFPRGTGYSPGSLRHFTPGLPPDDPKRPGFLGAPRLGPCTSRERGPDEDLRLQFEAVSQFDDEEM
jgi:uncharacterized protein with HEPN domain